MNRVFLPSASQIFLYSLIFGIFLGVLSDIFKVISRIQNNKHLSVAYDLLFMLSLTVSVFLFAYCANEGVYTVYMFIGFSSSFIIYNCTVSKYVVNTISNILRKICKLLLYLFNNTVITLYYTLDKFYKKGKINIERKIKLNYEKRLLHRISKFT